MGKAAAGLRLPVRCLEPWQVHCRNANRRFDLQTRLPGTGSTCQEPEGEFKPIRNPPLPAFES